MRVTIRPAPLPDTPRPGNAHGTSIFPAPLLLEVDGHPVLASHRRLPIATGSVDRLTCREALEVVHDDEALVREMARVLAPGGTLQLLTRNRSALAWLDGVNLYHYLRDISGRGPYPPESFDCGWRRSYRMDDLAGLLRQHGLAVAASGSHGTGIVELGDLVLLLRYRWLTDQPAALRAARHHWQRLCGRSVPIPVGRHGVMLEVDAVRR